MTITLDRLLLPLLLSIALAVAGCATTAPHEQRAIMLNDGDGYEVLSAGPRYFVFTLDEPARVILESHTHPAQTGLIAPNARLLDADGNQVARDWNSGRERNFRLEESLTAGTWYLHVMTPFAGAGGGGGGTGERHDGGGSDHRYRVTLDVVTD